MAYRDIFAPKDDADNESSPLINKRNKDGDEIMFIRASLLLLAN